jgi:uncharacterized protein YpmB
MRRKSKPFIILVSIILVGVFASATVFIFQVTESKKATVSTQSSTKTLEAKDIITIASVDLKEVVATKEYTFLPSNDTQLQSLILMDTSSDLRLEVQSKQYIQLQKYGPVTAAELQEMTQTFEKILTQNQFTRDTTFTSDKNALLHYSYLDVQCQLSRFNDEDNTSNSFQLTCTNTSDHADDLSVVALLLSLWDTPSAFDYVTKASISDDTYTIASVSTITLNDTDMSHTLLFAKESDTWTYIGDSRQGDQSLSNGKYILNEKIKAGIANPKYGPLLTKFLSTNGE